MAPAFVLPTLATNTAFFVVFGLFVVAMVVLIVIIIMWAFRNDRAGRRAWQARQEAALEAGYELAPVRQNWLALRAYERAQQRATRERQPPPPPSPEKPGSTS